MWVWVLGGASSGGIEASDVFAVYEGSDATEYSGLYVSDESADSRSELGAASGYGCLY